VQRIIAKAILLLLPSSLLIILLLELFFRFVIPAAELPIRKFDEAHGVVHFDPEHPAGLFSRGRFAEIRARWRINDAGWNSAIEYRPRTARQPGRPLVAVVGDSFVNGFQVEANENLAAVMRARLGAGVDVYRFGMPGAPLSQYLQMSRYVSAKFEPEVLVFVVVHNDFDESLPELRSMPGYLQVSPRGNQFDEIAPRPPPGLGELPWWAHSATARYLRITLRSPLMLPGPRPSRAERVKSNIRVDAVRAEQKLIRAATFDLVGRIARENADKAILFAMDAPRDDLYSGQASGVAWLNRLLAEACAAHGLAFLDLSEVLGPHFEEHGERFEFAVDAHWNALAHGLVGDALASRVLDLLPDPR
jgi:hypothetical protein